MTLASLLLSDLQAWPRAFIGSLCLAYVIALFLIMFAGFTISMVIEAKHQGN